MNSTVNVSAIIAAGGNATRLGKSDGKQLLDLKGAPVISYSISTIRPFVNEIILVIRPEDVLRSESAKEAGVLQVDKIVAGGDTRTASVGNALAAVNPNCEIVLIHDGARPFVSSEMIKQSIASAQEYGASVVAVPVKDTIKEVDYHGVCQKTLDRSKLWAAQTPQTFRYNIIKQAYSIFNYNQMSVTDDCALVEAIGQKVFVVSGSDRNFKITTESDLRFAEYLMQKRLS